MGVGATPPKPWFFIMRPILNYEKNKTLGSYGLIFMEDIHSIKYSARTAYFKCVCGNIFEAKISQVKCGHIKRCRQCIKKEWANNFIQRAKETHGDRYDYSFVNYTLSRQNVDILCLIHGLFKQRADNHIHGKGCPLCNKCGWRTRSDWVAIAKNRTCYLYLANYFNNNESFIKVGITSQISAKVRIRRNNPYNFNIIYCLCGDAKFIYNAEKNTHKMFKSYNYTPQLKFGGCTECYDYNIKETMLSYMKMMVIPNAH